MIGNALLVETDAPVLVTGATGYIAGWLVKKLLDRGVTVHAAVRDPAKADKVRHLTQMAQDAPGKLVLFKTDLLDPGSYKEAMQGCCVVFHTASPYSLTVKDAQTELVDPALDGTRNVLHEACNTRTVKRVVLTSSVAAIYGDNTDLLAVADGKLAEDQWNTTSTLDYNPYPYSKTVSEHAAWEIAESQSQWDLVVINPALVMGPALNPNPSSDSFTVLGGFGSGVMLLGVPDLRFGVVDVREVADAHIAAGFNPKANHRYILCAQSSGLMGIADCLRAKFSQYPLPNWIIPKPIIWLLGPILSDELPRRYVKLNVGYPFEVNNARSIEELGISYRPIEQSVTEAFAQMIEAGLVKKR